MHTIIVKFGNFLKNLSKYKANRKFCKNRLHCCVICIIMMTNKICLNCVTRKKAPVYSQIDSVVHAKFEMLAYFQTQIVKCYQAEGERVE